MTSQSRDLAVGVTAVVLGGIVAVMAATIRNTTGTAVGPGAFPLVIGIAVALAGLAICAPALRGARKSGAGPGEGEGDGGGEGGGGEPSPRRGASRLSGLALPAGITAFCVVAVSVSLTIASGVAFLLCCRYMAGYRWPKSVLIGLIGAVVVHVAFRLLLDVPLPGDEIL
ncbi:tripartite tricarboxylate transporter TctB family protein [Streptosporangium sp. NPDC006007]|uniref:tripartite tricarboxylate transporter TctB family protein n=1 Tax=Streptosporangium sp. NPDC006007 TaxID=3154575 RepID=UPI0033B8A51B